MMATMVIRHTELRALAAHEVLVETNSGTYGGMEAVRKVGSADPQTANYHVYETVGTGARRVVGCDPTRAPGRARRIEGVQRARAELLARLSEIEAPLPDDLWVVRRRFGRARVRS